MQAGYLSLETRDDRPGMVRFCRSIEFPDTERQGGEAGIRAIASYKDLDAAEMHVHDHLRHHLVDIDSHLYDVSLAEALAALHSLSLTNRVEWIDPSVDSETLAAMQGYIDKHKAARRRRDLWIRLVIVIAIALLVLNLVSSFLSGPAGP